MPDKIKLTDSFPDIISKLSEGNPGAITVLVQLSNLSITVDKDSFLGPFTPLIRLDSLGIYGENIWKLYKDCLNSNILHTLATLRASQLGLVPISALKDAITNSTKLDGENILKQVMDKLPNFNLEDDTQTTITNP